MRMNERRRMDAAAELDFPLPSVEEVANISRSSFAYQLPDHQLPSYHRYVCSVLLACAGLRKFDLEKGEDNIDHNRNNASPPKAGPYSVCSTKEASSSDVAAAARSYTAVTSKEKENPLGAWSVKCNLSIPIPAVAGEGEGEQKEESGLWSALKGKCVIMKDNIPIRGLPMYCGTSFFFTPLMDSPLVTRCLEAGATIVGKAQCEYMCLTASSHTASSGLVRNPIAPDYHAGGSSSGCAALVSARKADLSIGCDQGGSIRIPAAMCGVVGCKPTHGLVPYTYIDGMYGPIDHAGPITRTVEDNALMLGVLAGWDGVDERPSPAARSMKKAHYCKHLKEGVKGMRVGLVTEAITMPLVEDDVKKAIEDSAQVLREVGAEVDAISMPLLFTSAGIWVLSVLPSLVQKLFYSKEKDPLSGVDEHGEVYDRLTFLRENLLANVASWSIMFRINIIAGEWLRMRFPEALMVADVHKKRLIESYCSALSEFDVLLFPTTARKSKKLTTHLSTADDYEHASAELLAEHVHMAEGMTTFTLCSNLTGHPAVSVPVGGGLAKLGEDQDGKAPILSIGAMLVGNYFQEASLYRVAYALEQARCQHLQQPHEKQ